MKQNDIYMIQGTDYKEMTMKLLEHIDLASDNVVISLRIGPCSFGSGRKQSKNSFAMT